MARSSASSPHRTSPIWSGQREGDQGGGDAVGATACWTPAVSSIQLRCFPHPSHLEAEVAFCCASPGIGPLPFPGIRFLPWHQALGAWTGVWQVRHSARGKIQGGARQLTR